MSDDDRRRVIDQLSKHTGEGRLTLAEFEARVDEVWQARKQRDLQHALRELPVERPTTPVREQRADTTPLLRFVAFLAIMFGIALLVGKWVIWVAVALWFVCGGPRHRNRSRRGAGAPRREHLTHV